MPKTYSGVITSTITLTAANASYNPVTNDGTIATTTGDGIDGSGLAWSVTNAGTVNGNQLGIFLTAGGTIVNSSPASLITGNSGALRISGSAGNVLTAHEKLVDLALDVGTIGREPRNGDTLGLAPLWWGAARPATY